jgi:hypothetical protein
MTHFSACFEMMRECLLSSANFRQIWMLLDLLIFKTKKSWYRTNQMCRCSPYVEHARIAVLDAVGLFHSILNYFELGPNICF